jgi:hypothetical protein
MMCVAIWRLAISMACLLAIGGCGVYSTTSGRVDESVRRVAVPYLENQSSEPNIEVELTNSIIDALQDDNTLKVVAEKDADSILSGRVLRYHLKEAFATADRQVNEYQVQILVELSFTVIDTNEQLFAKKRISGTGNYLVDESDGRNETSARQEAASDIVRDVLALVVEDW